MVREAITAEIVTVSVTADVPVSLDTALSDTALGNVLPNVPPFAPPVMTPIEWNLADYSEYTSFWIDAASGEACLRGVLGNGTISGPIDTASIGIGQTLTILSDNTARNMTFTTSALMSFSEIVYVGGKTKNDTIVLEGSENRNSFTMNQETLTVDVYERPGKAKTQDVVFDTVSIAVGPGPDPYAGTGAIVKMSGTRSISIKGKDGDDTFNFVRLGTMT